MLSLPEVHFLVVLLWLGYSSHAQEYSYICIGMMVIHGSLSNVLSIARPILELQMYQNMFQKDISKGYILIKLI